MLLPIEVDLVSKKRDHNWNLIRLNGFNNSKMVFTLVTKVIVFYLGLTIIAMRKSGLKVLFLALFGLGIT